MRNLDRLTKGTLAAVLAAGTWLVTWGLWALLHRNRQSDVVLERKVSE